MKICYGISMFILAFALVLGCGDDSSDDSSSGGDNNSDSGGNDSGTIKDVNLSVNEDTPADELTTQELRDVCGDIYDAVAPGMTAIAEDAMTFVCGLSGVGGAQVMAMSGGTDAEVVTTCEDAVTACEKGEMDDEMGDMMDMMGASEEMTEAEFCDGAEEGVAECTATAGEIADCMVAIYNAQITAFKTYMAQMPDCGDLSVEYFNDPIPFDEMSDDMQTPSKCAPVATKCPDLLDEMQ